MPEFYDEEVFNQIKSLIENRKVHWTKSSLNSIFEHNLTEKSVTLAIIDYIDRKNRVNRIKCKHPDFIGKYAYEFRMSINEIPLFVKVQIQCFFDEDDEILMVVSVHLPQPERRRDL